MGGVLKSLRDSKHSTGLNPKNTLRSDCDERVKVCIARKTMIMTVVGCKKEERKVYTKSVRIREIMVPYFTSLEIEVDCTAAAHPLRLNMMITNRESIIREVEDGLGVKRNETFPPTHLRHPTPSPSATHSTLDSGDYKLQSKLPIPRDRTLTIGRARRAVF